MNKRDALRLQYGSKIIFGNNQYLNKSTMTRVGLVQSVTPKGGIRVIAMLNRDDGEALGEQMWVPYHHVIRVLRW